MLVLVLELELELELVLEFELVLMLDLSIDDVVVFEDLLVRSRNGFRICDERNGFFRSDNSFLSLFHLYCFDFI